ncbi:hypothetical protein C8J57DRAFT_1650781 [Mycena rebaudengoi]|nr:hypothetical protein C8J57DRAFT_1650781 [Mycena rebaudengoi]
MTSMNQSCCTEALEINAAPHPSRGSSLKHLGFAVHARFEQQGDPKDINEVISLHRQASTYIYSSGLERFSASHQWIRSATRHGHESSLDAYHTAINLLPQLAAFSLDIKSRQQMLAREDIVSLASASAASAITQNQNNLAVELLEASWSIFWAQALHLRTPVDKLESVKPELATKLRGLSQQLEQASFRNTSWNMKDTQRQLMSIEAVAAECRQLNDEWDQAVSAVRKVPGFEDFLQPKSFVSLQQAAVSGPIIILLASDSACSALIVKSSENVQYVKLPALKPQILEKYAYLPYIWQTIVKPVFEVLNLKNSMKLAFLSACETGKGDAKTPDEAMHLAASLLFAGFGGVIATMWTMNDDDGPKIADMFYEYLFKDCSSDSVSPRMPDLSKAAKALHLAVIAL